VIFQGCKQAASNFTKPFPDSHFDNHSTLTSITIHLFLRQSFNSHFGNHSTLIFRQPFKLSLRQPFNFTDHTSVRSSHLLYLSLLTLPYPCFTSFLELLEISLMVSDRELRSLGIRTTGTPKRKRNRSSSKKREILRTNASDLSAPAMSQSSDIFVDFSAKIRRVLEHPDRDVVLRALRDLAEGKEASISETMVDSLSGLGQPTSGNVSNRDYRKTMITLLIWGMRNFLIQPSYNAEHLWTSMSILDGPRGYAQR
jgi:hypothetical protein